LGYLRPPIHLAPKTSVRVIPDLYKHLSDCWVPMKPQQPSSVEAAQLGVKAVHCSTPENQLGPARQGGLGLLNIPNQGGPDLPWPKGAKVFARA
jgi:hypothetical protein